MKRPNPRKYGLNSDQAPMISSRCDFDIDPAQPITDDEWVAALEDVVRERVAANRNAVYADALSEFNYNTGSR